MRAFVREQGIVGKNSGIEEMDPSGQKIKTVCLSTYAWTVLALHTLLRFQILPNIHSNEILCEGSLEDSLETARSSEEIVRKDVMMTYAIPNIEKNILYRKIMNTYSDSDDDTGAMKEEIKNKENESAVESEILNNNNNNNNNNNKNEKETEIEKEMIKKCKKDFFSLNYLEKIKSLTVLNLFQLFFGYLNFSVDVYGSVLTMRNEGEV